MREVGAVGGLALAVMGASCSGGGASSQALEGDASVGVDVAVTATAAASTVATSALRLRTRQSAIEADFTGDRPSVSVGSGVGATRWNVELVAEGRGGAMRVVDPARPTIEGDRITYARGNGVREWFASVPRGVEHGFTIDTRLTGAGERAFDVAFDGVTPSLRGAAVALQDSAGSTRAWYGELSAKDANGTGIPARFATSEPGRVRIVVDDTTATYPIEIDPTTYGSGTALLPDTAYAGGEFGAAVGTDGSTVFVGEPFYNGQGAVYVYTPSGSAWTQTGRIAASFAGGQFGASIAVANGWMFVGAPTTSANVGLLQGYTQNSDGSWPTSYSLTFSPTGGNGPSARFGSALAFDGTTLVIGAPGLADGGGNANAGAIWVYALGSDGSWYGANDSGLVTWTTDAPVGGQLCGSSVAVNGGTILVGCAGGGGTGGALTQFSVTAPNPGSPSPWPVVTWKNALSAPAPATASSGFGGVGLVSGGFGLVGSVQSASTGVVYPLSGSTGIYATAGSFDSSAPSPNDGFGAAIAVNGTNAIIGAPNAAPNNGSAWQYVFNAATAGWTVGQQFVASDSSGSSGDEFGQAVAINGNVVVVGAPTKNGSGEAYVFSPPVGAACTLASSCASGFCVDGYCCNTACTGQCQACDIARSIGTCSNVVGGQPHNGRAKCATDGSNCSSCGGASVCILAPEGESCGTASCASGTEQPQPICNGSGACTTPAKVACSPYVCGATACKTTCATDADCISGDYCNGTVCATKLANGATATVADACQSGIIADGVCCATSCAGICEACNVSGKAGTCSQVTGNPASGHGTCTNEGTTCGGTCSATGGLTACTYATTTATCTSPICSGSTFTPASKCDGAGNCVAQTATSCGAYVCGSSGCKTSCASDTDCVSGDYCASSVCKPKLTNGTSATVPTQCASGIIADGVCCATTCADLCDSCDVSGHAGTCYAVSGAPASGHGSCTNYGLTCGGSCDGTHTTTCAYPTTSATCGSASCSSGAQTTIGKCDGVGDCNAGTTTSCGAFACGATACKTTCAADTDCASGNFCAAPNCVPKQANGTTATGADQCTSGFVADGVCCDSACSDVCDACNLTGHIGTCSAVTAGSHATGHPACTSDGSVCGGTCDGFSKTTCAFPNTSTACGAQSCSGGIEKLVPKCDGAGHCPAATTQACTPYLCGATSCSTTCATSADCVSGQTCNPATGACGSPQPNGTSCTTSAICSSGNCANGVCCNTACTDGCDSCNQTASKGTCTVLPLGSAGTGCGTAVCNGTSTSCPTSCAVDTDCASGSFCDGSSGKCVVKYMPGAPATGANQCSTGFLADGYCCNSACTGVCESCNGTAPGTTAGTCSIAPKGSPGVHGACPNAGTTCGGTCDGNVGTACQSFPTSTTTCGAATCASGQLVGASTCDGSGNCAAPSPTSCNAYACAAGACKTTCASDADCATGKVCGPGGVCGGPLSNASTCTVASDCSSGNCVEGVCCDTKCSGTCTACTKALTGQATGTCANITAGTDPLSQCAAPTCSASVATTNACNGSGACAATTTPCGAAGCSGTTCATAIDAGLDSASDTGDSGSDADATAFETSDAIVADAPTDETDASTIDATLADTGASDATTDTTTPTDAPIADAVSDTSTPDASSSDAAVCTNFGDPCGDAMSCNTQLQCVPGTPLLPGCGCTVPGQPTDDRTGWLAMAGGAMLIAAVGKRRRR